MHKNFKIAKYMLLIIGPIFIILSLAAYFHKRSFLEAANSTEGTVVELIKRKSDGSDTFSPVFVFYDNKKEKHKIYSTSSSFPPAYEVNEKVTVLYDPVNPNGAIINGFFEKWGLSLVLGALGAIQLFIGLVITLFIKK